MKLKYLLFLLGIFVLINFISASNLLLYQNHAGSSFYGVGGVYNFGGSYLGRTFSLPYNFTVSNASFWIESSGVSTGYVIVDIQEINGSNVPSKIVLTSAQRNCNDFDTSVKRYDFVFTTPYNFTANKSYSLIFEENGILGSPLYIQNSNNMNYNSTFCFFSTSWSCYTSMDFVFFLYGTNISSGYINDTTNETIITVPDDTGFYPTNLSLNIVDLNDTTKGLLPDVYYGLTTFFSNNFLALFIFFLIIFIALIVLAVAYQIKNIIMKIGG